MNLGQYIAQQLLEAEDQATIALFPGAFKPPHKGHLEVVEQLLQKADQVVILVSPKTRDGVTADCICIAWVLWYVGYVDLYLSHRRNWARQRECGRRPVTTEVINGWGESLLCGGITDCCHLDHRQS